MEMDGKRKMGIFFLKGEYFLDSIVVKRNFILFCVLLREDGDNLQGGLHLLIAKNMETRKTNFFDSQECLSYNFPEVSQISFSSSLFLSLCAKNF